MTRGAIHSSQRALRALSYMGQHHRWPPAEELRSLCDELMYVGGRSIRFGDMTPDDFDALARELRIDLGRRAS